MAGISTRVSVQTTDTGFFLCSAGDGQDNVEDERRQQGAVPSLRSAQALAAAETEQPGAFVFKVEPAERTLNVLKNARRHRGKYGQVGV